MQQNTKLCKFLIGLNIINFYKTPILLKSGQKSHLYFNCRNLFNDVNAVTQIAQSIITKIRKQKLKPDCFLGVPEGATPIALITQLLWSQLNKQDIANPNILAIGRGKSKKHGDKSNRYFINAPKGKTLVIEDVITTGQSVLNIIDKINKSNCQIIGIISLIHRDDGKSDQNFFQQLAKLNIKYLSLIKASELIPMAYKNYLKHNPRERLIEAEIATWLDHN